MYRCRYLCLQQSMCTVTSASAAPAALGHAWGLVAQSPCALSPPAQLMCHRRWDSQCCSPMHTDCCVCRHHVQASHPTPAVLQLWKRYYPFHKPSICPSWAGTNTQAHARAVQQSCSTTTGQPCWPTERECIRGAGQVRMSWALKEKTSRDPLSIAVEFAFTPNCNLVESVSCFQRGKL